MNIDEEIRRINGNDSVSFNRRDKLSQVVLMDGRILIFSGSQTKEAIATQQSVKRISFISWFAGSKQNTLLQVIYTGKIKAMGFV